MQRLTEAQVALIYAALKNSRDRLLCLFGLLTGFRISSILAVRVKDVYGNGAVFDEVFVARRNLKGGRGRNRKAVRGCRVRLHPVLRTAIQDHLSELRANREVRPDDFLFESRQVDCRNHQGRRAISRYQAYMIYREAAKAVGIHSPVGTHSPRKTFAHQIFEASGHNLILVQKALGHRNISTTIDYLQPDAEDVDRLVTQLPISLGTPPSGSPPKPGGG